jgi:hypothetical protein
MFHTQVLLQDMIEQFKNVLTVIKLFQTFNLSFIPFIYLTQKRVFYQRVKLRSLFKTQYNFTQFV